MPAGTRTVRGMSEVGWKPNATGPAFVMQQPGANDGARLNVRRPLFPTKVDASALPPGEPRTNG